jgi:hypothetical protein
VTVNVVHIAQGPVVFLIWSPRRDVSSLTLVREVASIVLVSKPRTPSARAAYTARWATTMTRWAIRFASTGKRSGTKAAKRWQFVAFAGPMASESRGIVDLIAIRRDHRTVGGGHMPGDLFEIIFIQIKGGGAAWPSLTDLKRLRAVQRRYRATAVVLASWQKGAEPRFYKMRRVSTQRAKAWAEVTSTDVFGMAGRA